MDDLSNTLDVAVFFDFENIVYSLRNNYGINANFEDLMDKCNDFGRVVVARAFADWNRQSSAMIPALMSNGFDPVYVPSFYTNENGKQDLRKNAVDMYMAIDAMDVLHNRTNVDTIILLTGDSDFLPLVNAIRRAGNRVIAIGVDGTVSSHLAQAVDEFIFYSQVSNLPANKFKKRPTDIYEGISEAIKKLQRDNRSTVLPNVKMMMGELLGGFDEKKYSDSKGRRFQKFKEFVQDAERRGKVQLVTTGTVNEVFLPDFDPTTRAPRDERENRGRDSRKDSKDSAKENKESKESKETSLTLDEAFELLVNAVNQAGNEGRSMRTSSIKGLILEQNSSFDEKKLEVPGDSEGFGRFTDFLTAAAEKSLVRLKGKSTRMEVHPIDEKEKDDDQPAESEASAAPETTKEKDRDKDRDRDSEEAQDERPIEKDAFEAKESPAAAAEKDHFEGRQLIIESLRLFNNYPASFLQIEAYCRQVRNERNIQLSSPKVRELLTEATRQLGILQRISPPGVSPAQYGLKDEPALVAEFLGISVAKAGSAAAPTANGTEAQAEEKSTSSNAKKGNKSSKRGKKGKAEPKAAVEAEAKAEVTAEPEQMSLSTAFGLLVNAVNNAISSGKSQKLSAIKRQMKQLAPDFAEEKIDNENDGSGFKRFSDFVKAAEQDGIVKTQGKGAQTEILLIE